MIQSRGTAVERRGAARLASALTLKIVALRTEWALGSVALVWLAFTVIAMGLQTIGMLSPGHFRPAPNLLFAALVSGTTIASLGASLALGLPLRRLMSLRVRQGVIAVGFAIFAVLTFMGVQNVSSGLALVRSGQPYNNDGAVMDLYAANRFVAGRNPYVGTNIVRALAAIDAPCTTTTPLMDGQFRGARAYPPEGAVQQVCANALRLRPRVTPPEFESKYNYPSGSFLFIVPLVWAGMRDMRFLYALAVVVMALYLGWRLPRTLRFLAAPLLLADVPLIKLTAGGQPDTIYGLFLLLAYAEWETPWLSPIMLGLAVATKQLAWFFVPFYLLLILRRSGRADALRRGGVIAGVFAALNLPFIIQSPGAYLGSLTGPVSDPMFPLGIGVIALFVSGALPMLPKIAFSLGEVLVWTGSLAITVRVRRLPPVAGVVLGALPLFFAWRSLTNYFYLIPVIALAVVLAGAGREAGGRTA